MPDGFSGRIGQQFDDMVHAAHGNSVGQIVGSNSALSEVKFVRVQSGARGLKLLPEWQSRALAGRMHSVFDEINRHRLACRRQIQVIPEIIGGARS